MKSLFAMAALFVGFCAFGGTEIMNKIPEFLSEHSVSYASSSNTGTPKNTGSKSREESGKGGTEATLRKIHAIPIAFVKYFAAEIKAAEISDLKLSQSNLDKLESAKQKFTNICKSKKPEARK